MTHIQSLTVLSTILIIEMMHGLVQCQHPVTDFNRHSNTYKNTTRNLRLKRSDFTRQTHQGLISSDVFRPIPHENNFFGSIWFHLLMKIDRDCIYRGYSGPAIFLDYTHFIASIFNMEDSAWEPCKNDPKRSGVHKQWLESGKIEMNFTTYISEKVDASLQNPETVQYKGRLGITEFGLYRLSHNPGPNRHIVLAHESDFEEIRDCYVITYIHKPEKFSRLSRVPVIISLSLGYGEFNIGWYLADQEFSIKEESGAPIFCNGDRLTFLVAPDEGKGFSNRFKVIHVKHIKPSIDRYLSTG